ncbi:hypothetical protein ACLB2K_026661 [Fragaria x ananassa]
MQQQVQDSGYVLQHQYDQQLQQQQLLQQQLQQQQQQFIHPVAHYMHHHPAGSVPIQAYYPVYPSQQQQQQQKQQQQQQQHHHHPQLDQQQQYQILDAFSFNQTPSQLFNLRLRRDSFRFNSLTSLAYNRTRPGPPSSRFSSSIVSGLSQGNGEYFTGIGIGVGSPPKYLYMVLDTGSDVVWLQCAPCKRCYSQTDPVFDPRISSSFSSLPCSSPLCRHLDSPGCSSL